MGEKTKELVVQGTKTELEMAISETTIKNLIYVIRGQQVMLDSDLAMLYHVETFNLNKAMKRNVDRFPEDFCFQLTKEEYKNLIFQSGISSLQESENKHGGNQQYPSLDIDYTEDFHDRFLIIDEAMAYHVGASLKDAGKKCFAINRIEDRANIIDILNRIKKTDDGGSDDGRE